MVLRHVSYSQQPLRLTEAEKRLYSSAMGKVVIGVVSGTVNLLAAFLYSAFVRGPLSKPLAHPRETVLLSVIIFAAVLGFSLIRPRRDGLAPDVIVGLGSILIVWSAMGASSPLMLGGGVLAVLAGITAGPYTLRRTFRVAAALAMGILAGLSMTFLGV